jgi:hypothetical protein
MTSDNTPTEKILKVCAEIEEARAKATSGEWKFNISTLREAAIWIPSWDGRLWLRADRGTDVDDWKMSGNAEFITLSANRILDLTKALRESSEALQDTVDSGYDQAGHCANALKDISELLTRGTIEK